MNPSTLLLSSFLVVIPIWISFKKGLGLEKEIIIGVMRAVVQLVLVGYVLEMIFGMENPIFTIGLIAIMVLNAAFNVKKRGEGIPHVLIISFLSIGVGTAITLGVLVFTGVLAFSPNEMIPVSGMVVNNAMVAIGLVYRNLITTIQNRRAEVEVKLSLGADPKEATKEIVKECLRLAMSPTVDAAKALGIVSLPGMMTGLILAGESPLIAIQFQIMVTFMLLASVSIATALASYFAYQAFFTPRKQLK